MARVGRKTLLTFSCLFLLCSACLSGKSDSSDAGSSDATVSDQGAGQEGVGTTVSETLAGPCQGYRTEVLFVDQAQTLWVGCGSDPGLFRKTGSQEFESVDAFENYLVYDIDQNAAGDVLVAGGEFGGKTILTSVSSSGGEVEALLEFSGSAPFMRIGKAENIAIAGDRMMVDSLTGNYIGYFDGTDWTEAYYWNEESLEGTDTGYQMSQVVASQSTFYATGSVINQPPYVFISSQLPDAIYHFEVVQLAQDNRDGATESLAVLDSGTIFAVGVDETPNLGTFFRCVGTCREPENWEELDIMEMTGLETAGKLWAIHFDPSGVHGIAVGDQIPQTYGGYALVTHDSGATWSAVTDDLEGLSAAWSYGDGTFLVAGGNEFMAVLAP